MRTLNVLLALVGLGSHIVTAGPLGVDPNLVPRAETLENPVLWQDHPDLDVFRVGNVYYYSSSSFAFSPGAPVLKSYDLAHWTPVSHSVPTLNFGSKYNLPNATSRAYVRGIWASTLQYRKSSDTFIWLGCIEDGQTYVWTAGGTNAAANNGEVSNWNWISRGTLPKCYYDSGLFIDDDDTMYVAYGRKEIMLAQLNADGTAEVKSQQVYASPDGAYIEGSRMYKINGTYYIFITKPADDEWVLKSSSPWGPYERRILVDSIPGPLSNAGNSHQGGIVDTQSGDWYYVAFMDAYPGGRIPVVAPLTWTADGWPEVVRVNGAWGKTYPLPVRTTKTVPSPTGLDSFVGPSLSHEWEWNHNPDNTNWRLVSGSGLQLRTATITTDLFSARNTLTHRILGPKSSGTFRLDISKMADGDRAGAVLFRDVAAYIGIHKEGSTSKLVIVNGLNLKSDWTTNSTGRVATTGPAITTSTADLWLRIEADITPAFGTTIARTGTFWYSTNGQSFTQLGSAFPMTNTWQFFTGYRFGVFNFATKALGGEIKVKSFELKAL
ncbi:glycosyl hydrolase family 43 protein [Pyrenochaeta sp. MPI-SDFR-AT-0127]|nr:glycosyl hydrolase family 43 protein [Pyrenochaeta sp. MPI-SDFR-AT-0127]